VIPISPLAQVEREPGVYWLDTENRWDVVPAFLGPTWSENPSWDGLDITQRYILPTYTLGWQVLKWISENLQGDEVDDDGNSLPFVPTAEQARFILWWYAIDDRGRFSYRQGVLQRLKGWGRQAKIRSSP
jgi:hypothetical protein